MNNNELIGVIATAFIILAFLQKGEIKIRLFDTVGAILFVIYGILINSFSTVLLNGILIAIQIIKLVQLWRKSNEHNVINISAGKQ